jgi:uncharacterized membrane protein YkgB
MPVGRLPGFGIWLRALLCLLEAHVSRPHGEPTRKSQIRKWGFLMTGVAEINRRSDAQSAVAPVSSFHYRASAAIPAHLRIVVPIRPNLTADSVFERYRDFAARHALFLLRLSLATVFFWFGALKVASVSPAVGLLRASIPFLAGSPYLQILGLAEIAIGMGIIIERFSKQATTVLILHLLGTLSLVVIAPGLLFAPAFPVLTMAGEFVLKNIVLITSALVLIAGGKANPGRV